ncbi:type IV secretory system conjugative DNA transfer family protein [Campylobacter magnus]|uniref:Type IV secretory system conjugative DNA transfer family protein n=1 Tax=Campylobacter magnus TaxID=3026462 RepID=A0ABT8T949_9BACT|nr:type IV secretory system conjugative DNA transfer family protein [Campylobacter magnus]MDO2410010.1 type IV secretory system conjugative DNA transfer family protein [Campylobacter magnus]
MKLNMAQNIFLALAALAIDYFLTGFFIFALNKAIKVLPNVWSFDFTLKALLNNYPKAYLALLISTGISSLIFFLPYLPKKQSLHGKARFANGADVAKMNLYGKEGIIIGKYHGKLLRFGGQQFVALGAPTRSGKGVGIVIPNLLDWNQSAVVQDIKQECFDFTSKYRAEILGQDVFLFNPFDKRTHRYNPLAYIDMQSDNADSALIDFANILYPVGGKDSTTDFFNQHAQNLFIGLCYMCNDLLTTKKGITFLTTLDISLDFTLYDILQLGSGFNKPNITMPNAPDDIVSLVSFEDTYKALKAGGYLSQKSDDRIASYFAIDSDNTRSGVMSSFNAPLMMFRADNMRLATSANDFDFRDLRKKKMTIFVGITPDQLANAKLILNIFWQQLLLVNTKELPQANADLKYSVMLLMDEFTASGYLHTYLKGISFIAGYGLRSVMIYQSNSQLESPQPDGYGKEGAKTLLTNHACQIYYTPREQEDAEKISRMLGNQTVKNRSRNIGKGGGGSESDAQRALMLPQELREMAFEDELITIDNGKPILCNKAFYYSDSYFMNKFKEVSAHLRAIKGLPSKKDLDSAIQKDETRISVPIQSFEKLENERREKLEIIKDELYPNRQKPNKKECIQ